MLLYVYIVISTNPWQIEGVYDDEINAVTHLNDLRKSGINATWTKREVESNYKIKV